MGIIAHMILAGSNPLRGNNYDTTHHNNVEFNLNINKEKILKLYGK